MNSMPSHSKHHHPKTNKAIVYLGKQESLLARKSILCPVG